MTTYACFVRYWSRQYDPRSSILRGSCVEFAVWGLGCSVAVGFTAGSSAVTGWKEFLFVVQSWENAYVCGF